MNIVKSKNTGFNRTSNRILTDPTANEADLTPPSILGLFPWFGTDSLGGAQLSGRLGWDGICQIIEKSQGHAQLFCYRTPSDIRHSTIPDFAGVVGKSKLDAVFQALQRRWYANTILIWHIDLLKLVPFFRLPKARIVLMLLGIEAWRKQDPLTQFLLKQVDLFLSISDHTWQRFLDFQPSLARKPHQTIYLGLGEGQEKTYTVPDPNVPIALMLSRLSGSEDYKGHREIIQCWPLVLQYIPNAHQWIAGDGDLRPELERLVKAQGLEHSVRFWGRVNEDKKTELLSQCRCFVMPSRGEGFGLVYVEAMRLGRPCLVSTLDAGQEVVMPPTAGLAVDPANFDAVSKALCRLLTLGTEWEQWSRQAQKRYEQHFTTAHFQKRLTTALFSN